MLKNKRLGNIQKDKWDYLLPDKSEQKIIIEKWNIVPTKKDRRFVEGG